jgi:hypothetical protein
MKAKNLPFILLPSFFILALPGQALFNPAEDCPPFRYAHSGIAAASF